MSDCAVWCRCVRPERRLERSAVVYVLFCDVASGGVRLHGGLHQRPALDRERMLAAAINATRLACAHQPVDLPVEAKERPSACESQRSGSQFRSVPLDRDVVGERVLDPADSLVAHLGHQFPA